MEVLVGYLLRLILLWMQARITAHLHMLNRTLAWLEDKSSNSTDKTIHLINKQWEIHLSLIERVQMKSLSNSKQHMVIMNLLSNHLLQLLCEELIILYGHLSLLRDRNTSNQKMTFYALRRSNSSRNSSSSSNNNNKRPNQRRDWDGNDLEAMDSSISKLLKHSVGVEVES